mmetsp:Transcript_20189/g.28393  ORF Transcript_20189/g.28393 Transcript_20189/m.28393 type:complete len:412 (-) Transcript_20189:1013-2248(-)
MASLKAMLSAQAKGDASKAESEKEIKKKEMQIAILEKRIVELEEQLEKEKAILKEMEDELVSRKEQSSKDVSTINVLKEKNQNLMIENQNLQKQHQNIPLIQQTSPKYVGDNGNNQIPPSTVIAPQSMPPADGVHVQTIVQKVVDTEALTQHKAHIAKLEEELDAEKFARREADGEIIKLRAQINGINLNEMDIQALTPSLDNDNISETEKSITTYDNDARVPNDKEHIQGQNFTSTSKELIISSEQEKAMVNNSGSMNNIDNESKPESPHPERRGSAQFLKDFQMPRPALLKSPSDFFPMIKRGFRGQEIDQEKEVMAVGWKVEVTNRKEREVALRDDVHDFEAKMKKFYPAIEQGIEVTMWQLNRNTDQVQEGKDSFALKATPVQLKLHRHGVTSTGCVIIFYERRLFE